MPSLRRGTRKQPSYLCVATSRRRSAQPRSYPHLRTPSLLASLRLPTRGLAIGPPQGQGEERSSLLASALSLVSAHAAFKLERASDAVSSPRRRSCLSGWGRSEVRAGFRTWCGPCGDKFGDEVNCLCQSGEGAGNRLFGGTVKGTGDIWTGIGTA